MTKRKNALANRTSIVELQAMPNGGGSDLSLKKDINEIRMGLKPILALRPVTWRWKSKDNGAEIEHGFIAQEVEQVLPTLVSLDAWSDGSQRKFLSTKEMIPYLVAAIQEQQAQINDLRSRVE